MLVSGILKKLLAIEGYENLIYLVNIKKRYPLWDVLILISQNEPFIYSGIAIFQLRVIIQTLVTPFIE